LFGKQLINNYTLMKKATRLLILTAFVFSLFMTTRAYAGGPGPGPGPRIDDGERARLGLDPLGVHGTNPFNFDDHTYDGFQATDPDNSPMHLDDPIGNPVPNMNRDNLYERATGHGDYGRPAWDPSDNGGGTAPLDCGISLLLAAGIGLGIKKARARKQTV
jgi:hypothetical protein